MVEEYGAEQYSEGVYGGEFEDLVDEDVGDYLPEVLPLDDDDRVITQYIDAHDVELDGFDQASSYVRLSRYVDEADGEDLELIGRLFGELGERGSRDLPEYRTYLSNLINSFNARGTLSGLRFAVAAAASTEPDNVIIDEDFIENEYAITIQDTDTQFLSSAINELAQLADPSSVNLSEPPVIVTAGDEIRLDAQESTVVESTSGIGSGTLSLEGDNTLQ